MSQKTFTEKEIKILNKNPYVKKVSEKSITYSDEFKQLVVLQIAESKTPRMIFEQAGFDVDIIGMKRIEAAASRWKKAYRMSGILGLKDTRQTNSGRRLNRALTDKEKTAKLEAKMKLLEAENEWLKKGLFDGKGVTQVVKSLTTAQKYELIRQVIERFNLTGVIHYFCDTLNVSRSGYYRYFSESAKYHRLKREEDDLKVRDVILNVFHRRGYKKGSRQIKMTLENEMGIIYSLKRIRRIMRKFDIICPHRKKNPYKKIVKATEEHRVVPNRLNREFRQEVPGKVLLTDITYVYYGKGQLAYLSTILDGSTNEILSYHISDHLKMPLVTETIEKLFRNKRIPLHPEAFIHSDQGGPLHQSNVPKLIKEKGLGQSMSRKGNCWDNAPQESFFGHFKDEALLKECQNLEELKREIKRYMMYHNTARYQWNLKKMTPVGYRNHLLDAA